MTATHSPKELLYGLGLACAIFCIGADGTCGGDGTGSRGDDAASLDAAADHTNVDAQASDVDAAADAVRRDASDARVIITERDGAGPDADATVVCEGGICTTCQSQVDCPASYCCNGGACEPSSGPCATTGDEAGEGDSDGDDGSDDGTPNSASEAASNACQLPAPAPGQPCFTFTYVNGILMDCCNSAGGASSIGTFSSVAYCNGYGSGSRANWAYYSCLTDTDCPLGSTCSGDLNATPHTCVQVCVTVNDGYTGAAPPCCSGLVFSYCGGPAGPDGNNDAGARICGCTIPIGSSCNGYLGTCEYGMGPNGPVPSGRCEATSPGSCVCVSGP